MPSCPAAASCLLHRTVDVQAALRVWESFYCEGSHQRCERFKLVSAGHEIPARLLPNGRLLEGAPDPGERPARGRSAWSG